jgi:hypothetical protein
MEMEHTSLRAIIDDDTIAIFESFLLCDNFCNIEEGAKYLYMPLFCLGT